MHPRQIGIIDLGSQYTQLIAKKTRELGYSCEIEGLSTFRQHFSEGHRFKALVLSGGPFSLNEDNKNYRFLFSDTSLPVLGICYGMQVMVDSFGGSVEKGAFGEYGRTKAFMTEGHQLGNCPPEINIWMSHFDHVTTISKEFEILMKSDKNVIAAIAHKSRPLLALQFHPEVDHTQSGQDILSYFYKDMAHLQKDWHPKEMLEEAKEIFTGLTKNHFLCAFSGGVDSLIVATLADQCLGGRLHCFFIDHGLLRPQDYHHIKRIKKEVSFSIEVVDAKELFLSRLAGVEDPEEKRKIIGKSFIDVFEEKVHEFEKNGGIRFEYLLQGTLYSDVIESSCHGQQGASPSATIKSHHNVGGLPKRMKLKLIEPLRHLFKDEVRQIGPVLGLDRGLIYRHPFPGPGIGIRIMGAITKESIQIVGQSDQILLEELQRENLYNVVSQAFSVFLPIKTVGIKGDGRVHENVICLRLVSTNDYMTAIWSNVPYSFLDKVSGRITNEVPGITRVVYDITSKPPGTIEWE